MLLASLAARKKRTRAVPVTTAGAQRPAVQAKLGSSAWQMASPVKPDTVVLQSGAHNPPAAGWQTKSASMAAQVASVVQGAVQVPPPIARLQTWPPAHGVFGHTLTVVAGFEGSGSG
jgi:hypothetical protein